jgi:protein transport protein SEC31
MNGIGETTSKRNVPYKLSTDNGTEGLICEAILTGNIEAAVELCMESGRTTDGIILAMTGEFLWNF